MSTPTKYTPVLCIGLGLSGLCVAMQLKRKYGLDFADMHFYDRNDTYSGTWWLNQYPGAACDIPAIFYSFSFAPNPSWTTLLPAHSEIRQYIDGVVDKYQLVPHMTFRTECESAIWDDERQRWCLLLRDLDTGKTYLHECKVLFSAVGMLIDPKHPNIHGMDAFEGPLFHTARWRHDVDLEGKNTIVIGNGCSGSQVVPKIVSQTKTLTQFIHTPHWLLPYPNPVFGPNTRWAFRHVPLIGRLMRFAIFAYGEAQWQLFVENTVGAMFRRALEKQGRDYVRRVAPEKYQDMLIPEWAMACKRRIFDANELYLRALHAPNLELVQDDIVEVLPRAVRTATKTYPADVIVLATGFETQKLMGALRIRGRHGEWLHEHWKKAGGPSAYNATAVHGFPNFFMLYGPNSNTGHTSVLMTTENTVNYALSIIAPVLNGEASRVEVKAGAERAYVARVQAVSRTRIISKCSSWYVSEDGWNSAVYPWSQVHFWWRSVFPVWRDWDYKYTSRHHSVTRLRIRRRLGVLWAALTVLGLIGAAGVSWRSDTPWVRVALAHVRRWTGVLGVWGSNVLQV